MTADALNRKETPSTLGCLIADFDRMEISYCYAGTAPAETQLLLELAISKRVSEAQQHDRLLQHVRKRLDEGKNGYFSLDESGVLWFKGRLCVSQKAQVKDDILREAHRTPYMVHPSETKMYQDLKKSFWRKKMKVHVVRYVASCGVYQ